MMPDELPPKARRFAAIVFGLALLTVLLLTLLPISVSSSFSHEDKLHHAAAFAGLATLAGLAWRPRAWPLVLSLALLGGAIEVAQHFLPPRSAEWGDWLADTLGAGVGCLLWPWLEPFYLRLFRRNS